MAELPILVVDDDSGIRTLTRTVLTGAGYDVREAATGEAAVEALGREPYALVLLDVQMPGMDGWQTLRLIRADDRLARTPVVMFTVQFELRHQVASLQHGADDFLRKPFAADELVRRVREVLADACASRASGRA
jgi:DNA-binding response OmpR family regulator